MNNIETVKVNTYSVYCNGKDQILDHPKVYLEIDKINGFTICPYCSKKFVYFA